MPLYEYECLKNRHIFEVRQPFTDDPIRTCPQCGSEVRRVIHPVGIVFKGSGFYATDSRGKGVTSSHKPPDTGDSKSADTKDSKADSKTDSKAGGDAKPSSGSSDSKSSGSSKET